MKSVYTNGNSIFPSQVVSDAEKASWEYGERVAQAIEQEWFSQGRTNGNRYLTTWNNYNRLRLYARGEQPTQKYLAIIKTTTDTLLLESLFTH